MGPLNGIVGPLNGLVFSKEKSKSLRVERLMCIIRSGWRSSWRGLPTVRVGKKEGKAPSGGVMRGWWERERGQRSTERGTEQWRLVAQQMETISMDGKPTTHTHTYTHTNILMPDSSSAAKLWLRISILWWMCNSWHCVSERERERDEQDNTERNKGNYAPFFSHCLSLSHTHTHTHTCTYPNSHTQTSSCQIRHRQPNCD